MRRRLSLLVGIAAFLFVLGGAAKVYADDWDWLRIICASFERDSIPWVLLGCYQIPNPASPIGS